MATKTKAKAAKAAPGLKPGDHVFLVDGSSYIFRAYHALPPLTRQSDGLPVGAVAGFCNMPWKLLQEGDPSREDVFPTHIAVVFDHSGKSFRNDLYPDYKANRDEPPEDLCQGVFCWPDEVCDPWTGECVKEGLDCGEILQCWIEQGMDMPAVIPCPTQGSAEGRRDFQALFTCLLSNCLMELLSGGDLTQLGLCALENCPGELMPCASGFL